MKCTNRNIKGRILAMIAAASLLVVGCGSNEYDMAYKLNNDVSSFQLTSTTAQETLTPFAADLCVVGDKDVSASGVSLSDVGAAALFNLKSLDTVYAKNANEQLHPASLTKIMTALVAIKYGSPDQMLTASENVRITEQGAMLCGLNPGDQMTLDQALHVLLLMSANDVAVLIAEGVAGSVEEFVSLMTAYDLYLVFQEALQYDLFNQIIQMSSYTSTYRDRNGNEKSLDIKTSNRYLRGSYEMPTNVTVIGGKTGTTIAAGSCLILLARSSDGTPYISVILKDSSGDQLYADMTDLLSVIQ